MSDESVIDRVGSELRQRSGITVLYDPPASGPAAGRFMPISSIGLHPALSDALANEYQAGFFLHQGLAVAKILAGENVVVATQTSSGKSLIYAAPAFDALLRDSGATALFIYPQKALANDQFAKLSAALLHCARIGDSIG